MKILYWQVTGFKENSSVENWVNTGMTGNISRQKAIIVELLTTNLCWICPRTLISPSSEICPLLFHNTEQYGWIQNPFLANVEISTQELSLPVRKCSTWWVVFVLKGYISEFRKWVLKCYFSFAQRTGVTNFSSWLLMKNDKRSMLKRSWWRISSCSFKDWT